MLTGHRKVAFTKHLGSFGEGQPKKDKKVQSPKIGGRFQRFFLGGGFKYFLFSTLFGEDSRFD